jgi:hypothetical protein
LQRCGYKGGFSHRFHYETIMYGYRSEDELLDLIWLDNRALNSVCGRLVIFMVKEQLQVLVKIRRQR